MANKTSYLEKALVNAWLRALTTAVSGTNASTTNILVTASAGFNLGDVVQITALSSLHRVTVVPDGTHVTISPATASTVTTGNMVRVAYTPPAIYIGLFTAAPSDITGGTEATGGSYARVQITQADGSWNSPGSDLTATVAGGNASATNIQVNSSTGYTTNDVVWLNNGSTEISRHTVTNVPDGTHITITPAAGTIPTAGTLDRPTGSSNASTVTFPTSTATWGGTVTHFGVFDALTTGNLLAWNALNTAQSVASAGITPSFAAGALVWWED